MKGQDTRINTPLGHAMRSLMTVRVNPSEEWLVDTNQKLLTNQMVPKLQFFTYRAIGYIYTAAGCAIAAHVDVPALL